MASRKGCFGSLLNPLRDERGRSLARETEGMPHGFNLSRSHALESIAACATVESSRQFSFSPFLLLSKEGGRSWMSNVMNGRGGLVEKLKGEAGVIEQAYACVVE